VEAGVGSFFLLKGLFAEIFRVENKYFPGITKFKFGPPKDKFILNYCPKFSNFLEKSFITKGKIFHALKLLGHSCSECHLSNFCPVME
jgi:hypothetical protein